MLVLRLSYLIIQLWIFILTKLLIVIRFCLHSNQDSKSAVSSI